MLGLLTFWLWEELFRLWAATMIVGAVALFWLWVNTPAEDE